LDGPPAEGRAPHARKDGTGLTEACDRKAPAQSSTHVVGKKCLGIRWAVPRGRTECVPPREPPLGPSPRLPPQGVLRIAWPFRGGGLCTPANEASPPPGDRPIGPPGARLPPMIMLCLGLPPALQRGRTECVPPRKPSFAPFPGLPPLGHASLDGPPAEGRALHARDDRITPTQMFPPFGHRPVANSSIIATWLGSPPALPPGRGDRAPPRKSPLALSPGLPRKAI